MASSRSKCHQKNAIDHSLRGAECEVQQFVAEGAL
jgi:hypothetical protein